MIASIYRETDQDRVPKRTALARKCCWWLGIARGKCREPPPESKGVTRKDRTKAIVRGFALTTFSGLFMVCVTRLRSSFGSGKTFSLSYLIRGWGCWDIRGGGGRDLSIWPHYPPFHSWEVPSGLDKWESKIINLVKSALKFLRQQKEFLH